MGERLNERIDNLRKQSRLLLAQVDQNSKRVKDEIKKLYSRNSIHGKNFRDHDTGTSSSYNVNVKSWKLRNDSSGVRGALHSEYYCRSLNCIDASMPNASAVKRVVVSSKRRCDPQCQVENVRRKPVKGCYCNIEPKKAQLRPQARTQHRQHVTCRRCKSHASYAAVPVENNFEYSYLNSPISCETLRRVQRIDYAPRSQFLRNVRSKVSDLEATTGRGDCPQICSRSKCYHEYIAGKNIRETEPMHRSQMHDKTTQTSRDRLVGTESMRSRISGEYSLSKDGKSRDAKSKRTIDSKERLHGDKNQSVTSKTGLHKDSYTHSRGDQSTGKGDDRGQEYISEKEMQELRKFREQNYFDTHGSSHTLSSSKSSCSLEQYLLNDRLFPEPVRRVHKKDLVVTMPPCATAQFKRIHYFPRYIVRQEKHNFNTTSKKKRCQSCPLTGHTIDLGITKIRAPLNSLALKYQKRLP